jgi:glycosyltransferase involved in cell wall biosynthesis
MKKIIYFEGLGIVEGHFSGVGQYILGIIRGIDEILDKASYSGEVMPEVIVIIPYDTVGKFKSYGFKHVGYKKFPLSFRMMSRLWHRGLMPPIDLWCGRGAYIFPRFVSMPLLFNKSALTIFDLSYELYRQYSDERNAIFLSKMVKKSLRDTSKVITISKHARQEIIDFYKLKPSKVVLATPATDPAMFYRRSEQEITNIKRKYGITGEYILALSNLEPRKNLSALIDAYCKLPKKLTNNTALLLVGVSGWKTEALFEDIVERVKQGYNIIRPSEYVADKDKPAIISGARMLVYPSHYEGFGMPPLEALACGVPIITADNSSLPEVVGNAGKMVSSTDTDELLAAMVYYLENIEEVTKKALIAGPERARQFSWTKSAQVYLDVAKELE